MSYHRTINIIVDLRIKQGRYDEAERLSRESLDINRRLHGPTHPNTIVSMYNLACINARWGRRAAALDWLRQAVDAGWRDADLMERDSDLDSLRVDPEFDRLLAATRKNVNR